MKYTISKCSSIVPLDPQLNVCDIQNATLQLEVYYSIEAPRTKIGVIGPSTGRYTYSPGNQVPVTPKIIINRGRYLTNIVRTKFLKNYLKHSR